ncbi:ANTAR domain-containing protein [Mycolicibacterium chubuense]|uniref:ANTAR domain protein n=1 Tax=Mycolicibacterium chubuense TaxID=1800 RepID=A0A0J6YKD3_MYCCU|nr:ANTAR domain-containing protein [Mycolicibacterium chubuense]KMO73276.1 ANTAR domain protein [Mycolicibacterium chubuense]ORA56725.1 ANTAR domain-containing protein [Mycolicibacterium chubuense]SPX98811.1 PAS/PAC sensor protein [Mycolicibacterium chubuense]
MTGALTASDVTDPDVEDLRREVAQLREKLTTQPVIEQAKGMLMQTFGLDAGGAFDILRVLSQNGNVKLRSIAGEIVEAWTRDGPRADFDRASDLLVDLRERLRGNHPWHGADADG